MRSRPSGRRTRLTSASPRRASGTLQKTRPLTTVSNAPSRNGSAPALPRTRRAPPRALERFPGGIETDDSDALAIEGEVSPGPTSHVEREAARALDEPPPPAREPQPLVQRAHRVVEPRDLLEAAHERTLTPLRGLLH